MTQPINNGLMDPYLGAELFIESSAADSAAYLTFHASVHQFVCELWQTNKGIQHRITSISYLPTIITEYILAAIKISSVAKTCKSGN
jgi:hypothetical protein